MQIGRNGLNFREKYFSKGKIVILPSENKVNLRIDLKMYASKKSDKKHAPHFVCQEDKKYECRVDREGCCV